MQYLYFFIGWIIGVLVFSFTLIQILTIFVFGIPTTHKLNNQGLLKENNNIIRNYFISATILLLIIAGVTSLFFFIFPNLFVGYLFGGIVVLFFGFGKVGKNSNNITDYIESNKNHFKVNHSEEIIFAINKQ